MGALILPRSGPVYADASVFIYSVEKHLQFGPVLRPLWQAAAVGNITVVTSELTVLETLVGPIRANNRDLVEDYERLFHLPSIETVPISLTELREAARLRAMIPTLRTPDAIHAATAQVLGCRMFLTNDAGFRRVASLPVTVLKDL